MYTYKYLKDYAKSDADRPGPPNRKKTGAHQIVELRFPSFTFVPGLSTWSGGGLWGDVLGYFGSRVVRGVLHAFMPAVGALIIFLSNHQNSDRR